MKVAIAGYGVEGKASCRYWQQQGADVTVVDERSIPSEELPEGVSSKTGPSVFSKLNGFDMVVRTASLPPASIATDGKVWSATNEFFARCPAPIIGVTGTKGKGTTSSMIAHLLRAVGKTVHLVGNIGVPALDILPTISANDYVVFEMSSFQLWDLEKSPSIAVVLMIEPDHLNVHADFDDYLAAKSNIVRYQHPTDVCIYHPTNAYSEQIVKNAPSDKRCFNTHQPRSVYAKNGLFYLGDTALFSTDLLQLPGQHNIENACAALTAVAEVVDIERDAEMYADALQCFQGLPHRLEYVRTVEDVAIYNDSFSSAPGATVAAVRSFVDVPAVMIIGGVDKGADFTELGRVLADTPDTKVLLIGAIRSQLQDIFAQYGVATTVSDANTMTDIVSEAFSMAEPGGVLVLSPGCASFDMFESFYDRGDQFREVIKQR